MEILFPHQLFCYEIFYPMISTFVLYTFFLDLSFCRYDKKKFKYLTLLFFLPISHLSHFLPPFFFCNSSFTLYLFFLSQLLFQTPNRMAAPNTPSNNTRRPPCLLSLQRCFQCLNTPPLYSLRFRHIRRGKLRYPCRFSSFFAVF